MVNEEFNFVVGFVQHPVGGHLVGGVAVMNPEKTTRLTIDHTKPITLERCGEIMRAARDLSQRDLVKIVIHHSIYSKTPGNELGDYAEQCHLDKRYHYDARNNSLLIVDRGESVFANDNGIVTRDRAALYDCLGD